MKRQVTHPRAECVGERREAWNAPAVGQVVRGEAGPPTSTSSSWPRWMGREQCAVDDDQGVEGGRRPKVEDGQRDSLTRPRGRPGPMGLPCPGARLVPTPARPARPAPRPMPYAHSLPQCTQSRAHPRNSTFARVCSCRLVGMFPPDTCPGVLPPAAPALRPSDPSSKIVVPQQEARHHTRGDVEHDAGSR